MLCVKSTLDSVSKAILGSQMKWFHAKTKSVKQVIESLDESEETNSFKEQKCCFADKEPFLLHRQCDHQVWRVILFFSESFQFILQVQGKKITQRKINIIRKKLDLEEEKSNSPDPDIHADRPDTGSSLDIGTNLPTLAGYLRFS
ncbi:rCG24567 [Rattus norvegicus]|uniref:RCG24567 n=1 Tax=Rattus norvegicus TaxID=10116 RepID=A6JCP7_RAT|nr:rCG24567 [Rattus norvegicus]